MALFATSTNTKLNPSLHYTFSSSSRQKPQLSTICFKPNLQITSKYDISNPLSSINQKTSLRLNYLVNTHDGKRRGTKGSLFASVGNVIPEESLNTRNKNGSSNLSKKTIMTDVIIEWARSVVAGRITHGGTNLSVIVTMHVLALFAPFTFSWGAFWIAVFLNFTHGLLGVNLSYHRNLSHKSFKLPKWLEYFFAYCGVLALQGNPIDWVSIHRYHHQYCETKQDPHSPLQGFWFGHMNWLFDSRTIIEKCGDPSNVADLEKQPFYRFMRSTYMLHPIALGIILYAIGGFPYVVWGMGVKTIWGYHVTWLVNSACHLWGTQSWNTGDSSRNNWGLALVTSGEGWHNNHHAFEYSARHGLEWWQVDMTWYIIKLLQVIGLAKDVKLPIEAHKKRLRYKELVELN